MGIGDWGLGIGDWPSPQSPIPNPQSPTLNTVYNFLMKVKTRKINFNIYSYAD